MLVDYLFLERRPASDSTTSLKWLNPFVSSKTPFLNRSKTSFMKDFAILLVLFLVGALLFAWNPLLESYAVHSFELAAQEEGFETAEEARVADLAEKQPAITIQHGEWRWSAATENGRYNGRSDILLRQDNTFVATVSLEKEGKAIASATAYGKYVIIGSVLRFDVDGGARGLFRKPGRVVVLRSDADSLEVDNGSKYTRRNIPSPNSFAAH